jgi:hypothetical protein
MNEAGKAACQPLRCVEQLGPHGMWLAGRVSWLSPPVFWHNFTVLPNDDKQNDISELPTSPPAQPVPPPREVGGREGPEPTRFGDWELRGRCIDF